MKEPPLPLQFVNKREFIFIEGDRLPHWNQQYCMQFVTFRLADSLPQQKLLEYKEIKKEWEKGHPRPWDEATKKKYDDTFNEVINKWIDAGYGSCILAIPPVRDILTETLRHFDGQRYDLHAYVVMPNHVHVLVSPREGWLIQDIVKGWKSFSAREINKWRGMKGEVWESSCFDHLVRNYEKYWEYLEYIVENPKELKPGTFALYVR